MAHILAFERFDMRVLVRTRSESARPERDDVKHSQRRLRSRCDATRRRDAATDRDRDHGFLDEQGKAASEQDYLKRSV